MSPVHVAPVSTLKQRRREPGAQFPARFSYDFLIYSRFRSTLLYTEAIMLVYLVDIHVKAENLDEFKKATLENAKNTRQEPKNVRFDVLQNDADETKFTLYEVYTDESGLEEHRQTPHYANWKATVENWMAEARKSTKCSELFFN